MPSPRPLFASGRLDRRYLRRMRYAFQWALFALILYGGVKLYLFTEHFLTGGPPAERAPLVEGFLPIGSLMTLKLWLTTGVFDTVHPAGLVIFASALAMSLALKKSFCGWVCPVGALSEQLYRLGGKIFFKGNPRVPGRLDYPLRSLKYLLMAFFLYVVLVKMDSQAILAFLGTPYWKVADVKMLFFFTEMTALTAFVLLALVLLSIPFKNFWCRYLCPYGALVGLLSYLSPLKVTRSESACIHCGSCTRHCPQMIPVEEKLRVRSPECTGCLTCVSMCPAKGALDVALPGGRAVRPVVYVALVALVFFGLIGAAKLTGHWHSTVSYKEYRALIPQVSKFEHP